MIADIPDGIWEKPALGSWSLRSLVGHSARAVSTVGEYLTQPSDVAVVGSAAEYFALARRNAIGVDPDAVAERGRTSGARLGAEPALAVQQLVSDVLALLDDVVGDPVITTRAGAMVLSSYLPTRTFELAVHSLDVGSAAGIDIVLPDDVLAESLALSVSVAQLLGSGQTTLVALTGRGSLPKGFSVV